MKRYRALAEFTTYAEVFFTAENEDEAYDIADTMDGSEFVELAGVGNWTITVTPADLDK